MKHTDAGLRLGYRPQYQVPLTHYQLIHDAPVSAAEALSIQIPSRTPQSALNIPFYHHETPLLD